MSIAIDHFLLLRQPERPTLAVQSMTARLCPAPEGLAGANSPSLLTGPVDCSSGCGRADTPWKRLVTPGPAIFAAAATSERRTGPCVEPARASYSRSRLVRRRSPCRFSIIAAPLRRRLPVRRGQRRRRRRHLPDLRRADAGRRAADLANATSSITQFPGYVTSTLAYWSDIKPFWRGALLLGVALGRSARWPAR